MILHVFKVWCIFHQELSKITMPVVFNEPLTFLQRITEYLEYSTLLNTASMQEDPADRMMVNFLISLTCLSECFMSFISQHYLIDLCSDITKCLLL